jgi:hypothetical protein
LTANEAAAFLPEVNRRIDQGRAVAARPVRPGLREVVWDHPRLSLASACTAILVIIGLTLSQVQMWGLSNRRAERCRDHRWMWRRRLGDVFNRRGLRSDHLEQRHHLGAIACDLRVQSSVGSWFAFSWRVS